MPIPEDVLKLIQAGRLVVWLRDETKAYERRVPLVPSDLPKLLESGKVTVVVERSKTRIIPDSEYEAVGAVMVDSLLWNELPDCKGKLVIVGLKELSESTEPIINDHIYFAHVFKQQDGYKKVLSRFSAGGGSLYDHEYLNDAQDRNIGAEMSPFAGWVGCALAISSWCYQQLGEPVPPVACSSRDAMIAANKALLQRVGKVPTLLVMGAQGRCGKGAVGCAESCGLSPVQWDKEETAKGGPFPEITETADIFVNCILLTFKIPPFLTMETIKSGSRKLTVITDVSCDPTSEFNPIPIYQTITSWSAPTNRLLDAPPLDLLSIDNLPSVLALEASQTFSSILAPMLLDFPGQKGFVEARKIFVSKMEEAVAGGA
mmetsp:Transcript_31624/g.77530  ORF Transcript_31624/g.77530 Transcript_31624/m.77530 type:complete len:374 (-) Transcript_31624:1004-2125(-)|eukprot:CAMPEP_0206223850 /NCGR_PEP_ID=MMETSP0047_2-20121206/6708_1 /ASSEMBLY_ACC=CAM_ASM_000192 /TAXON_ID=195065 /ORGANISM="Chroomonas mesostigmatica_cf, Strain CCMP1168" /LENGTH=373 /DNA_ID=CAMNT_0053646759 /DNA_START=161 /DNA_END=1282 /DNA_ORIENTATION=-